MRNLILAGLALAALIAPAQAVQIQPVTSPGGVEFWLVSEPSIPIVSVDISFDGGSRLDPAGAEGAANMMTSLLDEGAGDLDAVAFAKARADLSARFSFSAGRDSVEVGAQMLVESLDGSIDLLASALSAPRFDPEPVARVRGQILSGIAEGETDPDTIARDAWFKAAFPGHPYGRPTDGTKASVTALTVAQLKAAHADLLVRTGAKIGVVGAIDAARAGAMIDKLMGGLPQGVARAPKPSSDTPPPGLQVIPLAVPQSTALFGHKGIARSDPDFMAAYVVNYVLGGGGFTSRLVEQVRERRGLAYSVYSYLLPMDETALVLGGVQTANERMGESLDVIRAEWTRMATEGLTAEDLDKAKRYLTGAFALQFDSNAKISNYLVFLQRENLGIDYMQRRNALVEAVTLEDAARVAARILDPKALSIVVVGTPAGL